METVDIKWEISHYGEERERNATEGELQVFDRLQDLAGSDELRLTRKCDDYVSAVIGDWDVARIKYTARAKWLNFPCVDRGSVKRRIQSPADVDSMADVLEESLAHIRKYSE